MNNYSALNRLKWRVKSGHWKVNETDLKAVNTLIKHHEQEKQNSMHNMLFAKMYVFLATKIIDIYGFTPHSHQIRKKVGNVLKKDFGELVWLYIERAADTEYDLKMEEILKLPKDMQPKAVVDADNEKKEWHSETKHFEIMELIKEELNLMNEIHK